MKKKLRYVLVLVASLVIVMAMMLTACGSPEEEQPEEQIDYEIALVTDEGLLMDGGRNQAAWEAITEFGVENGISHKYYKAAEATDDACIETIDNAVSYGAKVIVADGLSFRSAIITEQDKYHDVKFILIDGISDDLEKYKKELGNNMLSIEFASEQAGYLAGYGAVVNGYTHLGFIGNDGDDSIKDYGYGFVQGADRAATESGGKVDVKYHYCKPSDDRNATLDMAEDWYNNGTEVIFVCGRDTEFTVLEAAELAGGKVITSDTDKSELSDTIISSATESIGEAISTALDQYKNDDFPKGKIVRYDASNEGIGLVLGGEGFNNLQKYEYASILQEMSNKTVTVQNHKAGSPEALGLRAVTIINQ